MIIKSGRYPVVQALHISDIHLRSYIVMVYFIIFSNNFMYNIVYNNIF